MQVMQALSMVKAAVEVAFDKVPVELATTPHDVVLTDNKARLLAYHQANPKYATPVLLLPSMVNRHTLLDLTEESSLVRAFLGAGFRTYLLDWGRPTAEDRHLPAAEYVDGVLHRAVRKVRVLSGASQVTLGGYCMGGSMALIYAALYPDLVKNLLLWATPVDFEQGGKLTLWAKRDAFDADGFVNAVGNAAPEHLQPAFDMLIPTWRLRQWTTFSRYGHLPMFVKQFVALSTWTADNVEVPAEVFRVVARDLYQGNKLLKGGLMLGGREVRLGAITASTLNLASAKDHIVVPGCAHQLKGRLGTTDVDEIAYPVGHLGLAMGPEALTVIWPNMMSWLAARS